MQKRSGWDRRAWTIGLIGGNACGLLGLLNTNAHVSQALAKALNSETKAETLSSDIGYFIMASCGLLLPGTLGALAHRRALLWGLFPITILAVWVYIPDAGLRHSLYAHTSHSLAQFIADIVVRMIFEAMIVSSLIAAGLGYEARQCYNFVKRKRTPVQQEETPDALSDAVWPPPPLSQ